MSIIRTVMGDIPPESLGICYGHEHLLGKPPQAFLTDDLTLDSETTAIKEMQRFYAAGGRALVEMTTPDYHRDAAGLRRIAQATGVQIIATTGYNKEKFCAPFIRDASIEELTARFIREVIAGMDDTDIRAGVIKASTMLHEISPDTERFIRAVARAHLVTNAPISTHTEAGTMALEQIALFQEEGVEPRRVIIGHMDRRLEWDYLLQIARTGVYMGFDQIGKAKYDPDAKRAEFILRLTAEGHGGQILLAGDRARRSYWYSYSGDEGFTYILTHFVPLLREQGASDAMIADWLVHNPVRALAFVPVT